MLKENNVRKGFFEQDEFLLLRAALPGYLKGFVTFAYKTGWRDKEISGITWKQVDLKQGLVRLETGETKNDEGRTVFLDGELKLVFREQFLNRNLGCPYVFHRNGSRIADFRYVWNIACRQAGLGYGYKTGKRDEERWGQKLPPGPIMHDFRRTAVRNLVRSGVPEKVAMLITGHKTRSVFDRYNIVSLSDLQEAAAKQEAYLNTQTHGHNLGTIAQKS
jgi:integrase